MNEIWRDCYGYEGLYLISNYGNVKSCDKLVWNRFKYIKGKIKQHHGFVWKYYNEVIS